MFILCREKHSDNDLMIGLTGMIDGLSCVLNNIFNCGPFARDLFENLQSKNIRICLKIMQLLIQSSDQYNEWYLNDQDSQRNIMHHMFSVCIPRGESEISII